MIIKSSSRDKVEEEKQEYIYFVYVCNKDTEIVVSKVTNIIFGKIIFYYFANKGKK
jgi:hypothetical protein